MTRLLQSIFKVYPQEVRLLVWVTVIQLAMRVSSVLINNYSQTAFLKRFGVEHLPTIFVVEAILTFLVTNVVGLLMERHRTIRVFTGLLLFYALCVLTIRGLLPFNILLLYPILFILKSQAIETLPILYWDILNDLFTTRQSKRLFTLISAGGVLGTTLGSIMTGQVARWVGVDNILLVFAAGMVVAALLNEGTERVVGAPLEPRTDRRKKRRPAKVRETVREVRAFSKSSPFLKYMILLVAIPNIILPILTFQFNVVLDDTYATEQDTLQFLGVFRGATNAIMFAILLFSGRLVSRWGVATSLLFHPINYFLAFMSLLFRFDILSAMYARFSTETLKTTLNNPARAVLYNFFPPHMRTLVRVFLRGTVVRAADLCGSGLLMLLKGAMDARFLSIVAAPLVAIWILTSVAIKRKYPSLLLQVLMSKQIDWRRLEDVNLRELAQDRRIVEMLRKGLMEGTPEIATLCGEILAQVAPPAWPSWVAEALPGKPLEVQRALLDLLTPAHAQEAIPALAAWAQRAEPQSLLLLIPALTRLDPRASLPYFHTLLDHASPTVRAWALVSLFCSGDPDARQRCHQRLKEFLPEGLEEGPRPQAPVGERTEADFLVLLVRWAKEEDPQLRALGLWGLSKMKRAEGVEIAFSAMDDPMPQVRSAALQAMMEFGEAAPLEMWIRLLADEDSQVREKASRAIRQRGDEVAQFLIPALASPSRRLRNEILAILDDLETRPVELSQFIGREMEKAYTNLAHLRSLRGSDHGRAIPLLRDHLLETNETIQETVLRVLAFQELGERMEVILRALRTGDKRDVDNAIEALESCLHSGIRKILIPLLEDIPLEEKISYGRSRLGIPLDGTEAPTATLITLLRKDDPVAQMLSLYALGESPPDAVPTHEILSALDHADPLVREAGQWALRALHLSGPWEETAQEGTSVLDKLLSIRQVPMFQELRVRELVAIAAITLEKRCSRGEVVVREGDEGDILYLVLKGDLKVLKGMGTGREMRLATIAAADFFGEMALFDRQPRSASVLAESDTQLLMIEEATFTRIMKRHPAIPMNICRVLSQRVRASHERIQSSREGTGEALIGKE
jgi:HEAT repeat protein